VVVIIDTCFLVALRNQEDENHEKAKERMKEILEYEISTF